MQGIAASPGIAIGKVYLFEDKEREIEVKRLAREEIPKEIETFHQALALATEQIVKLKGEAGKRLGNNSVEIFEAHQLFLEDPDFIAAVEDNIRKRYCAATAVMKAVEEYSRLLRETGDEYLRAREADFRDVGKRIIDIITGTTETKIRLPGKRVVVARDLTPSETVLLDPDKVLAFVTAEGTGTAHTAILSRSLGIPAVVGVGRELLTQVTEGMEVIVDGFKGMVIYNPEPEIKRKYQEDLSAYLQKQNRLKNKLIKEARTSKRERVAVFGNMGRVGDLELILENGGEGIGLLRTEILYMGRKELPSEEEQFAVYRGILQKMEGRPVIIRTLDIGGDKDLPYLNLPKELNPFLGVRAIRLCLERPDIFKPQLRAILRASNYGNLKVMFPMITSLEELVLVKGVLKECKQELEKEKVDFNSELEVGIMIEVPAAAVMAEQLAAEVSFFSIGTNDLIQYTLALDRTNERLTAFNQPYHPAVLALIKRTIVAGHQQGIKVGMCGEMAGDELMIPFLLGTGLDEFSVNAGSIQRVKEIIGLWSREEAAELTEEVLSLKSFTEIKKALEDNRKD